MGMDKMINPTDEQRASRLRLYAAYDQFKKAIDLMPVTDAVKSELGNLATVTLRMALLHNDGQLSPRRLQTW
jgi:hypothetical protein